MITHGGCVSYTREMFEGIHRPNHEYKLALFTSKADLNRNTTTYTGQAGESEGLGYTAGGVTLYGFSTGIKDGKSFLQFNPTVKLNNVTLTTSGGLIYNASLASKNAVCVLDFGGEFRPSNGPLTIELSMPLVELTLTTK